MRRGGCWIISEAVAAQLCKHSVSKYHKAELPFDFNQLLTQLLAFLANEVKINSDAFLIREFKVLLCESNRGVALKMGM